MHLIMLKTVTFRIVPYWDLHPQTPEDISSAPPSEGLDALPRKGNEVEEEREDSTT